MKAPQGARTQKVLNSGKKLLDFKGQIYDFWNA